MPQGSKFRPAGVAVEERKYCSVETVPTARNNRAVRFSDQERTPTGEDLRYVSGTIKEKSGQV